MNKYETDPEDRCSVVKGDLVDSFQAYTNRVLSPRWFTSIYKLFPRVTSTRKLVNDRFVYSFHLFSLRHSVSTEMFRCLKCFTMFVTTDSKLRSFNYPNIFEQNRETLLCLSLSNESIIMTYFFHFLFLFGSNLSVQGRKN